MASRTPETAPILSRLFKRGVDVATPSRVDIQRRELSEAMSAAQGMNQRVVDILRMVNEMQGGKWLVSHSARDKRVLGEWSCGFQEDQVGLMLMHSFGMKRAMPPLQLQDEHLPLTYFKLEAQQDSDGRVTSKISCNDPYSREVDRSIVTTTEEDKEWLPQVRMIIAPDGEATYQRRNNATPMYVPVTYTQQNFDDVVGWFADYVYVAAACE